MRRVMLVAIGLTAGSALLLAAPPEAPLVITARDIQQAPPQQKQQQEVEFSLTNPGTHPKIGIQNFDTVGTTAVRDAAETIASVLAADLTFEREFYVIDRKASAGIKPAGAPSTLPFAQWEQLGAEAVVMGTIRENAGKIDVEIRLASVKKPGVVAFARSFGGCTLAAIRYCAHTIADDMHKEIRALNGIARTRLAFVSDRDAEALQGRPYDSQGKEIYIADYDGFGQRRITANKWLNLSPTWGPDARTLAYTTYTSGRYPDIYVTMLDGRAPVRPAGGTETIHNYMPAVSPDGRRIAFASSRGMTAGYYDIWVADRDGRNLMNLTPGTEKWSDSAPAWSPTGLQIAFTSDRTGINQLYVMNADGTGVKRMSFAEKVDRPTWAFQDFIAYTLERPGSKAVALYDIGRNETRVITDGSASNDQPSMAPNGRHIAFVTNRWGTKRQIATIAIDGKDVRQVTTAGTNTYPSWSPSPGGK